MISVEKLKTDLDYWIFIGIADDIVTCSSQRPEYQGIVNKLKKRGVKAERMARLALYLLKKECLRPWFLQPTFYRLIYLEIKRLI